MTMIYQPPARYTTRTPLLAPILVNFLRAGAIVMLDWVTLRFVEHAPISVWVATGIVSLAILAVIQSKEWLDFRGPWYFTSFIGTLLLGWLAIVGYAYWFYYSSAEANRFPTADEIAAAITRAAQPKPAAAPIAPTVSEGTRPPKVLKDWVDESKALLDIFRTDVVPIADNWRTKLLSINPDQICLGGEKELLADVETLRKDAVSVQTKMAKFLETVQPYDRNYLSERIGGLSNPTTPMGINPAIVGLAEYSQGLFMLHQQTCDALAKSNAGPRAYAMMSQRFQEFSDWITRSQEGLTAFHDESYEQWRNAR